MLHYSSTINSFGHLGTSLRFSVATLVFCNPTNAVNPKTPSYLFQSSYWDNFHLISIILSKKKLQAVWAQFSFFCHFSVLARFAWFQNHPFFAAKVAMSGYSLAHYCIWLLRFQDESCINQKRASRRRNLTRTVYLPISNPKKKKVYLVFQKIY